jgi:dTMP kinase
MFITFEGLDGSGKTTQVQRLASWLRTSGQNVLQLREPGGTRIGDAVRLILHDRNNTNMDARAELLLYCASRAQLITEQVQPHLSSGAVVLSDRFADSTLAYQGYGRGLDMTFLRGLLEFATRGIKPDLTLYFDVDPDRALQRRMQSGDEVNRLDAETIEFHQRVRHGYSQLMAQEPQRWHVIDASQTQDHVAAQVKDVVKARLNIAD